MAKQLICEELRRFIKDKIQTVLRLEILLLLHDQQSRSFNAAQIANELGFETEATQDLLFSQLTSPNTSSIQSMQHSDPGWSS
jgi:hypothetical protein